MVTSPHYDHGTLGIIYFSRGRGRGHAVPDMAIARDLVRSVTDLDIRFVSYSTGAEALRACGFEIIDLGMTDEPAFLDMIVYAARVIGRLKPGLVIAHEEFAALPAAQIFAVPCVFITDFFQDPTSIFMNSLRYALDVIFTGEAGIFTEPPYLGSKVHYVGPAVRAFEYHQRDRDRARRDLDIPGDATVIFCQPGSWSESQMPIAELVISAWEQLPYECKRLLWLAGDDYDVLRPRFNVHKGVTVIKQDWQIDRLITASDLIITKANRLTVYEAASLGVPSLSISQGSNWPDDVAVAHVLSNTSVKWRELNPRTLSTLIAEKIAAGVVPETRTPRWDGVARAAGHLAKHIACIRQRVEQENNVEL